MRFFAHYSEFRGLISPDSLREKGSLVIAGIAQKSCFEQSHDRRHDWISAARPSISAPNGGW
jgi:hypothetical protein